MPVSRRTLMRMAGAAAVAGGAAGILKSAPDSAKPMRLGGPIFVKSEDPGVLAKAHLDLGYRAAYVPSNLTVKDTELIAATAKEFAARDVAIAEVGAWKNMLDPDAELRRQNIAYVTERLALAEMVGARNCVEHRRVLPSHRLVRPGPEESE